MTNQKNKEIQVYGANGIAYINYNGSIKQLSKELTKGLNIPDFWFKNDTESPFEISAYCETLGFECFLFKSTKKQGYNYCFEMETFDGSVAAVSTTLIQSIILSNVIV